MARKAHGIGGQVYQGSIRVGGEDRIVALTGSANVDALTGWHEPENGVLVLISEGQGERLEEAAYDAAESNVTTGRGRILAAGNPVRPHGRFYKVHQRATWRRFRTSAADTPNVKAGELVRSGFPAPGWPEDVASEYGEDSGFYVGRVRAEFPEEDEDGLFRRAWLDDAVARFEAGELEAEAREATPVAALDPSRHGPDSSVLFVQRGRVLWGVREWKGRHDTGPLVAKVVEALEDFDIRPRGHPDGARGHLIVDEAGLDGPLYGLRERGYRAHGFNGGRRAVDTDRYFNRRAEAYWRLRRRLERGELALPEDERLFRELLAIRYRVKPSTGQTQLESKRDLKSRIGRSPDRADALSMLMAAREVVADPQAQPITLAGMSVDEWREQQAEDEGEWQQFGHLRTDGLHPGGGS